MVITHLRDNIFVVIPVDTPSKQQHDENGHDVHTEIGLMTELACQFFQLCARIILWVSERGNQLQCMAGKAG